VKFDGSASQGDGPLSCTWTFRNSNGATIARSRKATKSQSSSGCVEKRAFSTVGTVYATLRVRDASGDTSSVRHALTVRR
jgi:hypothetical protein